MTALDLQGFGGDADPILRRLGGHDFDIGGDNDDCFGGGRDKDERGCIIEGGSVAKRSPRNREGDRQGESAAALLSGELW